MEPNRSSPEMNMPTPESLPNVPSPEFSPGFTPEAPVQSPERQSSPAEHGAEQSAQAQAAIAAQPTPISLPAPVQPQADDSQAVATDDLPAVAADDDLIEKEWVDKAKQIIGHTAGDPAQREKEVSRLQADYLKKRYGKELGASTE